MVIKYEVFVRNQLYLDYLNKHWCQEVHLPYGSDRVLEITVWGRLFTQGYFKYWFH